MHNTQRVSLPNSGQHGFSLISVVVTLGLIGILAPMVAQGFAHGMYVANSVRTKVDLENLRHYVRAGFDCGATTSAVPSCIPGDVAILNRSNGTVLIDLATINPDSTHVPSTHVGKYKIFATCIAAPSTYNVSYVTSTGEVDLVS